MHAVPNWVSGDPEYVAGKGSHVSNPAGMEGA